MPDTTTSDSNKQTQLQRLVAAGVIPLQPQQVPLQPTDAAKLTPMSAPTLQPVGQPISPGGLQKINLAGDPADRAPLDFKERQALPVVSPGAPAGSLASTEAQLGRLKDQDQNPWGSAGNHPGTLGHVGHWLGRIANAAGDIVDPRAMRLIPGTELNRQAQEAGLQKEADVQGKEQATEEATKAAGALGTRKADIEQEQADTAKEKVEQDKPEKLAQDYADAVIDAHKRGVDPSTDPTVQQYGDAITALQKPAVPKAPDDFDQFYTGFLKDNNLTDTAANRLKARTQWEAAAAKPPTGTFMPLYDQTGKVTGAWDPATGKIQHAPTELPGTTSQGQGMQSKALAEFNKNYEKPAEDIGQGLQKFEAAYKDYKNGAPTGAPSMVALSTHLATTFGSVKGARMNRDMIEEHRDAIGWMDRIERYGQQAASGQQLSPDQWKDFGQLIRNTSNIAWQVAAKEAQRSKLSDDQFPAIPAEAQIQMRTPKGSVVSVKGNRVKEAVKDGLTVE